MVLPEYLSDVAKQMKVESDGIRRDFASHRLSAGENREDLVSKFLKSNLPARFGVSNGIIISHDGAFSNQADLVIVDGNNNVPLYANSRNKLWPVEAVYALIEVKTTLNPSNLSDAIAKGRRFKRLKRNFCNAGQIQRIPDSLFVIWAFESASTPTVKSHLISSFKNIPFLERPDLVIVLNQIVAMSGSYWNLARLGKEGSEFQTQLHAKLKESRVPLFIPEVELAELGENSLLVWYLWFDSWLRQAGFRLANPLSYLPVEGIFGRGL